MRVCVCVRVVWWCECVRASARVYFDQIIAIIIFMVDYMHAVYTNTADNCCVFCSHTSNISLTRIVQSTRRWGLCTMYHKRTRVCGYVYMSKSCVHKTEPQQSPGKRVCVCVCVFTKNECMRPNVDSG